MENIHLLLADKNLSYLEIARKMLQFQDEGYQVDVTTSGDECIQKLFDNNYDLLLLDYDIDNKNGLDILGRIVGSGVDVPIVMLVEEDREDIAFKSIEKGAYDYIMKARGYLTALPFTVSKVLEKRKVKASQATRKKPIPEAQPQFQMVEDDVITEEKKSSQDAFCLLDRKGRFLTANTQLEELLNYLEEELLELTLADLIPPEQENSYFRWLSRIDMGANQQSFRTELIGKHGDRKLVEISFSPTRSRSGEIINYEGRFEFDFSSNGSAQPDRASFDQARMINEMVALINSSLDNSFNHLLQRISQLVCQFFQFKRATLAILDRRRKIFLKQIMIGYTNGKEDNGRILEVPQDVINQIFTNQYKVKVVYYNQELNGNHSYRPVISERREQPRRMNNQWHPQDIIIFNLTDHQDRTFGYISVDEPLSPLLPSREIFYNMEIFSSLASVAIENFYRYASLEKRNRRLKQLLISSNLFKLHLSISEMMKEIVWSIKFSLDFNLVMLGLISRKSKRLEIKSVASDDRIKTIQLKEITLPVDNLQTILKKEYRRGKCYLINEIEPALRKLKDIYYDTKVETIGANYWHWWTFLIVPIYERRGKIIGFIMVDDPNDSLIPSQEEIHTLEILANQISIAIENRLAYLQIQERLRTTGTKAAEGNRDRSESGIKKLVDYFFK